ncbi:MAG: ribonuclease Z [Petrimonas sp.]|uniref:ribonuclease Z n=1 Tax=Petrimonas sp. TaxID=2023866 RepID=UPI002B38B114|nr:ribonuclease Z [Petrimonas sp.]MEA4978677.1 ribonuclease Z [Petrimonas sp.]MEA5046141.1 ribonuclease Z [Petrimonas sp.]MEA5062927.1 ribonuclease Z [Petrimonas sp.]
MTKFQITILGCGSATPTTLHNPSSQLVNVNEKLFMIDCGEGTQLQLRKFKTRIGSLHSIFISHLHGDHVFGLPGLLASLSLLGRTSDLNIYAHKEMDLFLNPFIKYFGNPFSYKINLIPLDPHNHQLIFENNSIRVFSFPLKHRIPTNGFLFEEKERPRHIKREMIDFYNIPIRQIKEIKSGADFLTDDGKIINNEVITTSPTPPRKYAYCSDTAYSPEIISYIQQIDVLYHEATFAETESVRAQETFHSTARQAAEIAKAANVKKLVIGHFSSRYNELSALLNEATAVFPETELAYEGMIINL